MESAVAECVDGKLLNKARKRILELEEEQRRQKKQREADQARQEEEERRQKLEEVRQQKMDAAAAELKAATTKKDISALISAVASAETECVDSTLVDKAKKRIAELEQQKRRDEAAAKLKSAMEVAAHGDNFEPLREAMKSAVAECVDDKLLDKARKI